MRIEVDQSGKIERTNTDTVLAFSNQEQNAILVGKEVKQKLFRNRERKFKIKFFAICLYLLLRDKINNKELIIIDEEYYGQDRFIKKYLLDLIRKDIVEFDKRIIRFGRITKSSKAHNLAILTYRRILRPNKIISEDEILNLLK